MDCKIESFDASRMNWGRYMERIKFFLEANNIKEELRKATVLTIMGDFAFNLLCDLLAPGSPSTSSLEEIFSILETHFNPKPLARIERFNLRKRVQQENEPAAGFAAELRKLSIHCNLRENLNCSLVDQFIFGINDITLQKRLLLEKDDVSFDSVIQLAIAAEISNKSANILQNKPTYSNLLAIKAPNKYRQSSDKGSSKFTCVCCGRNHKSADCSLKEAECFYCKRKGHIKAVCRSFKRNCNLEMNKNQQSRSQISKTNALQDEEEDYCLEENNLVVNTTVAINSNNVKPFMVQLNVDGQPLEFEVDSGAAVSILPQRIFKKHWPKRKLLPTALILRAFDHLIKPLGICKVNVIFNNHKATNLDLIVTKEGTSTLLGRAWFQALGLTPSFLACHPPHPLEVNSSYTYQTSGLKLRELLNEFKDLFSPELGCIVGHTAKLYLKDKAIPKFCKHRPVPLALLPKIEEELLKLQSQGILVPIKCSRWAAPIVPIVKKTGDLRLCGDYKVGLNPNLEVDQYPLPIIEEILTKLAGGTVFSKLDLAQAYQQVPMDEESTKLIAINTHKGLFSVTRLPFGVASAPAIFQQIMDTILAGIEHVSCYLDDILIASADQESHLIDLKNVFTALDKAGVRLKLEKCDFFKDQVEYLGHIISREGIKPSPSKVKAITLAPTPKNSDQLRSFLGLVGYYRKFIPDLASKTSALNKLLCKNCTWSWGTDAATQFEEIKSAITSNETLAHFDPKLPIILATDASPWGIGAILSHKFPDGLERPIMFASRSLSKPEQNYSQLDKEALGIIFGVKKFHKFLFGRKFVLFTDHKPLTRIFHAKKEIPVIAASRLQRWALMLSAYNYEICYKTSRDNMNADALSRLPIQDTQPTAEELADDIMLIHLLENFPWSVEDIAQETSKDPELSKICTHVKNGWPRSKHSKETPPTAYKIREEQLSLQEGCLLWGLRVVIPTSIRHYILEELHKGHIGVVKMKLLARSICWWPKMDHDIEQEALSCKTCQLHAKNPTKSPLHHWIRPGGPWQRLHLDLMGPFLGKNFLVMVDAFSKWPEVTVLPGTSSESIMLELDKSFTRFGYPNQLITDNGTQFTSNLFAQFCKNRGISHTKSPPYHPASNGQAEKFVDTFKNLLIKLDKDNSKVPLQIRLNELLFKYRCTPHATLGQSPAQMLLGRNLRDRLQRINPLPPISIANFKGKFTVGQRILARSYHLGKLSLRWEIGTIRRILSPVSYWILFEGGKEGKRHVDQIRPCHLRNQEDIPETTVRTSDSDWTYLQVPTTPVMDSISQNLTPPPITLDRPVAPAIRYSSRARRPPDRLTFN